VESECDVADGDAARGDLSDAEWADFCALEDRVRRGEMLPWEDMERRQELQLRVCPPPSPEWLRVHDAKLRAQGIDLKAKAAKLNARVERVARRAPVRRGHDRGHSRSVRRVTRRRSLARAPGQPSGGDSDPHPLAPLLRGGGS
jgi:hypothetical protein